MASVPANGGVKKPCKVRDLFHETFKNVDISKNKLSKVRMLKLLAEAAEAEAKVVEVIEKARESVMTNEIEPNQAPVRSSTTAPDTARTQVEASKSTASTQIQPNQASAHSPSPELAPVEGTSNAPTTSEATVATSTQAELEVAEEKKRLAPFVDELQHAVKSLEVAVLPKLRRVVSAMPKEMKEGDLDDRTEEIVEMIGPALKEHELVFKNDSDRLFRERFHQKHIQWKTGTHEWAFQEYKQIISESCEYLIAEVVLSMTK